MKKEEHHVVSPKHHEVVKESHVVELKTGKHDEHVPKVEEHIVLTHKKARRRLTDPDSANRLL